MAPLYKDLEPYKLSTLVEVKLSFISLENISQRGVGFILKSLQTGINMKKFSIIFSNCINIDQETFEELGKLFRALKNLEKLTVAFANFTGMRNIKAGEPIASLANSFLSSKKLQKFEISFAYTHDSIMEYSFSVFENFCSSPLARRLKELTIDFRNCRIVNDNYLKTLGKEISKLSRLKKLSLDVRDCSASEIGVKFLKNQLKEQKRPKPLFVYKL